jgi:predicted Zn finger-like uncharacterized protein
MDVTCEKCQTEYEFDDALVSEQGTSVRCTQCGHRFKVRRPTGGGAPEIWIVRTVEGQALEFRALRDLKNAIAGGKIGRDDVLSRGAGRPRRLASIAELEPFFSAQPRPMLNTAPGLGSLESPRPRKQTPSGLGPGERLSGTTEGSIAIPLPRELASPPTPVRVPPPAPAEGALATHGFEEEERTEVKPGRKATKELRMLGEEPPPPSIEPPTIPEPPLSGEAPPTALGVAPPVPPVPKSPDSITKTMAYGTPRSSRDSVPASEPEPVTGKRPVTPVPPPAKSAPPPAARPAPPPPAEAAAPVSDRAAPSSRVATVPPAPEVPVAPPPPDVHYASAEPPRVEPRAGREPEIRQMRDVEGRASVLTPTPPDVRYSLSGEEADLIPSGQRGSAAISRRSAGSMRLIIGLLVGGAAAFAGVVLWQKFLPKDQPQAQSAVDPRVAELLEAGEKALRDGDLEGANDKFVKASGIDEKNPRVLKSLARLAVVRAELAWLELRILAPDDKSRDKTRDRLNASIDRAQKAVDLAQTSAADDPEVARVMLDLKRISGDVGAARKLAATVQGVTSYETDLSLGALDMTDKNLAPKAAGWTDVLERLGKAADAEGTLGRARALLVYAAALSGDAARARAELDRLAKLPRSHPLEGDLRRFLDRVDKGESPTLAVDELPTVAAPAGSAAPGDSSLRVAQEALSRGQYAKAEELYRDIVTREQSNPEALFGLAQASLGQGKAVPAKSFLERAVKANGSHAPAILALANIKWDSGERSEAAALYRRALDLGVTGKAAELAKSRTQALPSSASGGATAQVPEATTTGGSDTPPPPDPEPPPATSGGSDVPPDL